jgi:putative transcriptional regulator
MCCASGNQLACDLARVENEEASAIGKLCDNDMLCGAGRNASKGARAMRNTAMRRLVLALGALLMPAALLAAVPTNPTDTSAFTSLRGQFLVATPAMRDPRFDHTVILMLRHDRDGAFGIVINRPAGEKPLSDLLGAIGDKGTAASGSVHVFGGGPVEPQIGFVIHSTDYRLPTTLDVDSRVAMTSNAQVLRDIADGKGPKKSLVAFGYAGWAPGQLEGELGRNAWYVAPADENLIFDDDRDKLWDHAVARRIQDL